MPRRYTILRFPSYGKGAAGGQSLLNSFDSSTGMMDMGAPGTNHEFLQTLVEGMRKWTEPARELTTLHLNTSGLGGETTEASLSMLAQLLHLLPSIRYLSIKDSNLKTLPSSFIDAVISHPTLIYLNLSGNNDLGRSLDPSTPCAINLLLSKYHLAASSSLSSRPVLRRLYLTSTEMTADCCGPVLDKILSLGPKGFQELDLDHNPSLSSYHQTLNRIKLDQNFFITRLKIDRPTGVTYEDGLVDKFYKAGFRNDRLKEETRKAALEVLKLSRVIVLGSRARQPRVTRSTKAARPAGKRHLLDFPPELLPIILSFVHPGALSDRQIASILQRAGDRRSLVFKSAERENLEYQLSKRPTRNRPWYEQEFYETQSYKDDCLRALSKEEKTVCLDDMGCFGYDGDGK